MLHLNYNNYNTTNKQEIWNKLKRKNVSKGLTGRIKNMYDEYENIKVMNDKESERLPNIYNRLKSFSSCAIQWGKGRSNNKSN
jgi:hypothetical protein